MKCEIEKYFFPACRQLKFSNSVFILSQVFSSEVKVQTCKCGQSGQVAWSCNTAYNLNTLR